MKTKTLALVNGLVGLIGGIILLLWPFFIWVIYFMLGVFDILKIAILAWVLLVLSTIRMTIV